MREATTKAEREDAPVGTTSELVRRGTAQAAGNQLVLTRELLTEEEKEILQLKQPLRAVRHDVGNHPGRV